jgi:hypothetical protein
MRLLSLCRWFTMRHIPALFAGTTAREWLVSAFC